MGSYYARQRQLRYLKLGAITAAALLLVAGCAASYPIALKRSVKYTTLTVNGKESVNKDSGHEYRVYTDHGVYVVSDSLVFGNWRAADRYATLEVGHTYRCKQAGWRIGFFSEFPNLLKCEEV